jgi:hypothetical protein
VDADAARAQPADEDPLPDLLRGYDLAITASQPGRDRSVAWRYIPGVPWFSRFFVVRHVHGSVAALLEVEGRRAASTGASLDVANTQRLTSFHEALPPRRTRTAVLAVVLALALPLPFVAAPHGRQLLEIVITLVTLNATGAVDALADFDQAVLQSLIPVLGLVIAVSAVPALGFIDKRRLFTAPNEGQVAAAPGSSSLYAREAALFRRLGHLPPKDFPYDLAAAAAIALLLIFSLAFNLLFGHRFATSASGLLALAAGII